MTSLHNKPSTQYLVAAIVTTLHYKANLGLPTILHKIKGHTHIGGNDLADTTVKCDVSSFEDIPEN